ncbi:MAG TPA: methylmalonyl-CoA epimerase [Anaerolineales bacterium]|nr:methylmalonyl-CoA epimerase [Anaerolineales bacterium]
MPQIKKINHVAILVDDLEKPLVFWRDALGLTLTHMESVPAEQAEIAFLPVGDSEIELVRPTTDDSGLARYLAKRGAGMHHLCLEVDDIAGMLAQLKAHGVELINEEPRQSADGRKYAFIHPRSANGVMVELYELPN